MAAYLMALSSVTEPSQVDDLIKQIANQTGALVTNDVGSTTRLIANNGNL